MIETDANPVGVIPVWHVVFRESQTRTFWNLFTVPGYRHVAAYGYSADNDVWIVIDPGLTMMAVQVLSQNELTHWVGSHASRTSAILRMKSDVSAHFTSRFGHSCVFAVKQLLGLPSGAFTPQGLFREMRKHGAEDVFLGRLPKRKLFSWLTSLLQHLRLKPRPRKKPA